MKRTPLHPDYVPSVFPHRLGSAAKGESALRRYARHSSVKCQPRKKLALDREEPCVIPAKNGDVEQPVDVQPNEPDVSAQQLQNNGDITMEQLWLENAFLRSEREDARTTIDSLKRRLSAVQFGVRLIRDNDDSSRFYTGLHWHVFETTFEFLAPFVTEKTKDSLPFVDQFFVTLVRLRLDLPFELLSGLTGVSETTVRTYFWKWVDVGYAKLSFVIRWPDRESLVETLPAPFKARYPRLTSIIDCFEIFIDQPSELDPKRRTYSSYKKHTTVKCLIACTPLGAISFLSLAWGGRVSDIQLVRQSGFVSPTLHRPGDQILADRGFTLQDDFATMCSAELIIPAFTKGKKQLEPSDVEGTREIANIRIHIERVIGLLKNRFKILCGPLSMKMVKTVKDEAYSAEVAAVDRILTLCAALCNLGDSIVYKE